MSYVKNWRPLTLLNCDYKILAKVLASRLEKYADKLIGSQQTGFIKGCSIRQNLHTTAEILGYLNKNNLPGVIVTIDFEKCFDRIEYKANKGTLEYFNFGPNLIKWLFLLFNRFTLFTQNNGYISNLMNKTHGVNQGCPTSPLVYNYTSKVMAHLIQQNRNIRGISVNGVERILAQFVDDTNLFIQYERLCIEAVCDTLTHVENNLGLKVSYEKTNMYRVGSLYKTDAKYYTAKDLN